MADLKTPLDSERELLPALDEIDTGIVLSGQTSRRVSPIGHF